MRKMRRSNVEFDGYCAMENLQQRVTCNSPVRPQHDCFLGEETGKSWGWGVLATKIFLITLALWNNKSFVCLLITLEEVLWYGYYKGSRYSMGFSLLAIKVLTCKGREK